MRRICFAAFAALIMAGCTTAPPERSFIQGDTRASETDEAICRAHAVIASRHEPGSININQTAIARTDVRINSPTFNSGFIQQPTMADFRETGENIGAALAGIERRAARSRRQAEIYDAVLTSCMVSTGWEIESEGHDG